MLLQYLMTKFFFSTIYHFSSSQTCFLQIPAHYMYLSFGATLEPSCIGYCTFWSVGGQPFINEGVVCLIACKMQGLAYELCLNTFFFQEKKVFKKVFYHLS